MELAKLADRTEHQPCTTTSTTTTTTTPSPPPHKKRRLIPLLPRLNSIELLASFGSQKSPGSVTKMNREAARHSLRAQNARSYAESPPTSADNSPSKSVFDDADEEEGQEKADDDDDEDEDSEDELTIIGEILSRWHLAYSTLTHNLSQYSLEEQLIVGLRRVKRPASCLHDPHAPT